MNKQPYGSIGGILPGNPLKAYLNNGDSIFEQVLEMGELQK